MNRAPGPTPAASASRTPANWSRTSWLPGSSVPGSSPVRLELRSPGTHTTYRAPLAPASAGQPGSAWTLPSPQPPSATSRASPTSARAPRDQPPARSTTTIPGPTWLRRNRTSQGPGAETGEPPRLPHEGSPAWFAGTAWQRQYGAPPHRLGPRPSPGPRRLAAGPAPLPPGGQRADRGEAAREQQHAVRLGHDGDAGPRRSEERR